MQLCALDTQNKLVFAHQAIKHTDYFCLECSKVVRLRSGLHRQPHFFHIQPTINCRQHSKGMAHLLLQYYIKARLPEQDAHIEHRFDAINRIADVAWVSQKLVYEIQYSPISGEEILARNADYASIGYKVIWVLHDKRYNQKRLTSAEDILQKCPHYFSDMNIEGSGTIYDQFALVENGYRATRLPKHEIDFSSPISVDDKMKHVPAPLLHRANNWNILFSGDTVDRYLKKDQSQDEDLMLALEKLLQSTKIKTNFTDLNLLSAIKKFYFKYIHEAYIALMRLFLERTCR